MESQPKADIVRQFLDNAFPQPDYVIQHRWPDKINHEFTIRGKGCDVLLIVTRSFLDDHESEVIGNLLNVYQLNFYIRNRTNRRVTLSNDGIGYDVVTR
jgi:hypothetical protein